MERWQGDYITRNLPQLLNNTLCDTSLLACLQSSQVIGVNDIQSIRVRRQEREKAYLLYEILKTRTNGYLSLMKALQECSQTGAYNFLMNGVLEFGFVNLKINFHGKTKSLGELLVEAVQIEELLVKLKTSLSGDTFLDLVLMYQTKESAVALVRDTIPAPLPYYVQRRLTRKNEVTSKEIFREECTDIFVFKGVNRAKLTELIHPILTTSSSSQLMQVTGRFIYLEQEADWEEIRNNAKEPAHLIKIEEETYTFILLETSQPSQVLKKYLQHSSINLDECAISEDEFLNSNLQKHLPSNMCICDTPGMGKSVLLANLARKIADLHSQEQIVAYITFSQFLDDFDTFMLRFQATDCSFIGIITNCISPTIAAQMILSKLIENKSLRLILCLDGFDEIKNEDKERANHMLRKFKNHVDNVKVCITARPHMRNDLETNLGLIAYDILAFTETDQLHFLTDYWKGALSETHSRDRLTKFSKLCMQNLQKVLSKQERDIMGIPLQCSLLAQVYTKQAGLYSNLSREPSEALQNIFPEINSVYDLYSKFFELRFSQQLSLKNVHYKTHNRWGALNSIIGTANNFYFVFAEPRLGICAKNDQIDCMQIVKKFHIFKALQLLFPSLADEYALHAEINNVTHSMDTFLPFGILEARSNGDSNNINAEFVHRTFAEFLVANFFTEILTGKFFNERKHRKLKINVIRFFVENALSTCSSDDRHKYDLKLNYYLPVKNFQPHMEKPPEILSAFIFKHYVIIYFLNEHLARIHFKIFPDQTVLVSFLAIAKNPSKLYQILASCICNGFVNLLRLLKQMLKPLRMYAFLEIQPEEQINEFYYLICLAAEYSNLGTVRECVDFFREYFKLDMGDLTKKWHLLSRTPLHSAIERADYDMVEYLVDKISLEGRALLYYCIGARTDNRMDSSTCSYTDSDQVVKNRTAICELLVNKNSSILAESCYNYSGKKYNGPLAVWGVHTELVKLLVRKGADIRATFDNNENIVYRAIGYMSPADFHELCRFLIEDCQAGDLFRARQTSRETPILHQIVFRASRVWDCTVEMILNTLDQLNVNEINEDGNNLIGSAVLGDRSLEIIKRLVAHGVNWTYKNHEGRSVLHLAVKRGKIETIDYFISLGLSLNDCDCDGNTPFFSVSLNFIMTVNHLVDTHSKDVHETDKNGDTIAHKTCIKYVNDFNDLTVFLLKPSNGGGDIFKVKNHYRRTPLHVWLTNGCRIPVTTLHLILSTPGLDVTGADADGNNLFLSACKGRQNVSVLKCLVGFGADSKHCNNLGRNAFHLSLTAMQRYFLTLDMDIIEYIASLGVKPDQPDKNGIIPLNFILKNFGIKIQRLVMNLCR